MGGDGVGIAISNAGIDGDPWPNSPVRNFHRNEKFEWMIW
jgi:hypothetical protein